MFPAIDNRLEIMLKSLVSPLASKSNALHNFKNSISMNVCTHTILNLSIPAHFPALIRVCFGCSHYTVVEKLQARFHNQLYSYHCVPKSQNEMHSYFTTFQNLYNVMYTRLGIHGFTMIKLGCFPPSVDSPVLCCYRRPR